MNLNDLFESSPPTPEGSITDDLLYSKIWLVQELKNLNRKNFSTIYVLGSWYGNMSIVLDKLGISADKIINVDKNKKHISIGKTMIGNADLKTPIENMIKDVNSLNYRQLDKDSLVINTSILDIDNKKWWDNIPHGTLVALQSRDEATKTPHDNLEDLENDFPLSDTLFKGAKPLEDPETKYNRFMIIGTK